MININPKKYNLSSRIALQENALKELCIVVKRKSRIIMKDGRRLLEIAEKIKQVEKNRKIKILSSAPFCSKTKVFLKKKGLIIQPL